MNSNRSCVCTKQWKSNCNQKTLFLNINCRNRNRIIVSNLEIEIKNQREHRKFNFAKRKNRQYIIIVQERVDWLFYFDELCQNSRIDRTKIA